MARVRAIQSQNTAWLLIRPYLGTPAINPAWLPATNYKGYVGLNSQAPYPIISDSPNNSVTIVDDGRATYFCIADHLSSASGTAGNEPGVGATWRTYWVEIADYQYNYTYCDVQNCTTGTCLDTSPYNPSPNTMPLYTIQFNWFGVPADYIDHVVVIDGTKVKGDKVKITVTSLGKITQGAPEHAESSRERGFLAD